MGRRGAERRFDFAFSTSPQVREMIDPPQVGQTISGECFGRCGRTLLSEVYISPTTGKPTYNRYCDECWQAKKDGW